MIIEALKGDVATVAPTVSQACALWVRSGFNGRCATWDLRIRPDWQPLIDDPPDAPPRRRHHDPLSRPWLRHHDSLFQLGMAGTELQYAYVFSNPNDSFGYTSLEQLHNSLWRCLETLSALEGIERVSFIHMPLSPLNRGTTREDNLSAATEMVRTLREWAQTCAPNPFTHVYLIDLRNDFSHVLTAENY
jgi:hypothetical protein